MPNYVIAYHGARQITDEAERKVLMQSFMQWLKGLGDNVVSAGTPVTNNKRVTSSGVSDDSSEERLTGYSVVKADNIETAIGYAKDCPHLTIGTIEVGEAFEIKMDGA